MTRRDRIIRLAELRGDKAALAIMGDAECHETHHIGKRTGHPFLNRHTITGTIIDGPRWTESELRALWGDR